MTTSNNENKVMNIEDLKQSVEALMQSINDSPEEQRRIIQEVYEESQKTVNEMATEEQLVDIGFLFSSKIIANKDIIDEQVLKQAVHLLDTEHSFLTGKPYKSTWSIAEE